MEKYRCPVLFRSEFVLQIFCKGDLFCSGLNLFSKSSARASSENLEENVDTQIPKYPIYWTLNHLNNYPPTQDIQTASGKRSDATWRVQDVLEETLGVQN